MIKSFDIIYLYNFAQNHAVFSSYLQQQFHHASFILRRASLAAVSVSLSGAFPATEKNWWRCIPILLICVITASPSFLSILRRHQVSSIFMQPVHYPSLFNTHHLAPVAEEARIVNIARHAEMLSCNLSSYMKKLR